MFKQRPVKDCILIFGQYFLCSDSQAAYNRDDTLIVQPHLRYRPKHFDDAAIRVVRVAPSLAELSPPWWVDAYKARQSKQELRNIWMIFQACDELRSENINVH